MRVRHKRTLACRILLAVLLLVIIVCAAAGGIWLSAMHSLGKHAVCGTDSGYETDGCVLEDTAENAPPWTELDRLQTVSR